MEHGARCTVSAGHGQLTVATYVATVRKKTYVVMCTNEQHHVLRPAVVVLYYSNFQLLKAECTVHGAALSAIGKVCGRLCRAVRLATIVP
jgi:hypothetical protein